MRRATVLLLPILALACTDPASNVGLDLLDEEGGPEARAVLTSVFGTSPLVDITGAAPRVLTGQVDDPLAGTVSATGYVDFSGTYDQASTDTINQVTLRLSRNYVYGDTTGQLLLNVHDIAGQWDAPGLKADTSLESGAVIATAEFSVSDTLVVVPLPDQWISRFESTLKSANFDTLFHGFALESANMGAIVGFRFQGSSLQVVTSGGTTTYGLIRSFSGLTRTGSASPPEGVLLFQDGVGPGIQLDFEFADFDDTPINGAILEIPADSVSTALAPINFVRPLMRDLHLVAVGSDPNAPALFLAEATIESDGIYRFTSLDLVAFVQGVLLGSVDYAYLELRAPVPDNTLNAVLLRNGPSDELAPKAHIILSP